MFWCFNNTFMLSSSSPIFIVFGSVTFLSLTHSVESTFQLKLFISNCWSHMFRAHFSWETLQVDKSFVQNTLHMKITSTLAKSDRATNWRSTGNSTNRRNVYHPFEWWVYDQTSFKIAKLYPHKPSCWSLDKLAFELLFKF